MAIPYLPPEILTNIFLRLPIKALTNARFVNKYWHQLISSSDFVKSHLKISTLSDQRMIFPTRSHSFLLDHLSIGSLSFNPCPINLVNFGYRGNRLFSVWLEGSCNGIVCLLINQSQVLLLNPFTGMCNKLPPLDDIKKRCVYINYGFGYDEANDDYKVVIVRLSSLKDYDEGGKVDCCSMVHVYSLKSNSWKRIKDFKRGVLDFCRGKLVNGKVHWFTNPRFDERRQRRVVSFDVASEVFEVVQLPVALYQSVEATVDVLEGCMCMLLGYEKKRAELWVMKEYGVKESWTRVVTISYANVIVGRGNLRPWSVFPTGELLFLTSDSYADYRDSCAVYNPEYNSLNLLDVRRMDYRFQPHVYVPSLVSPLGT